MTTVLDRVDVNEVSRQAHEVRFSVALLTAFTAVFFAIGWTTRKLWLMVVWSAIATRAGWRAAGKAKVTRGPAGTG